MQRIYDFTEANRAIDAACERLEPLLIPDEEDRARNREEMEPYRMEGREYEGIDEDN